MYCILEDYNKCKIRDDFNLVTTKIKLVQGDYEHELDVNIPTMILYFLDPDYFTNIMSNIYKKDDVFRIGIDIHYESFEGFERFIKDCLKIDTILISLDCEKHIKAFNTANRFNKGKYYEITTVDYDLMREYASDLSYITLTNPILIENKSFIDEISLDNLDKIPFEYQPKKKRSYQVLVYNIKQYYLKTLDRLTLYIHDENKIVYTPRGVIANTASYTISFRYDNDICRIILSTTTSGHNVEWFNNDTFIKSINIEYCKSVELELGDRTYVKFVGTDKIVFS